LLLCIKTKKLERNVKIGKATAFYDSVVAMSDFHSSHSYVNMQALTGEFVVKQKYQKEVLLPNLAQFIEHFFHFLFFKCKFLKFFPLFLNHLLRGTIEEVRV
jgi:hypothetical protein